MSLNKTSFSSNGKNKGRTFALHQRIMQASSNITLLKKPLDEIEDIDPSISGQLDLKKVLGDEIIKQLNHLDDSYIPSKHKKLLEIISPLISNTSTSLSFSIQLFLFTFPDLSAPTITSCSPGFLPKNIGPISNKERSS